MNFLAKSYILIGLSPLLIVVLSVNEVRGGKSLSPSLPEDLEMSSIGGGGGGKHGSESRHSSKPRYSAQSSSQSQSHSPSASQSSMSMFSSPHGHSHSVHSTPLSSYSNLSPGYYSPAHAGLGLGGYNSYPGSSSYRYNSNYLYGGGGGASNPIIADPYERTAREYSPSSMTNSYSPVTNYADSIASMSDMYMSAASQGGGGGGGGGGGKHGWGWGWGHGHGGNQLGDKGLGLLGLLGLLSLLQGVLAAFRATTAAPAPAPAPAPGRRRKRSLSGDHEEEEYEEDKGIIQGPAQLPRLVLPYLNVIAHATQGTIPMNCTQRQVCFVNKIIKKQLGAYGGMGNIVAEKMSHAMQGLLLRKRGWGSYSRIPSNDLVKSVETASRHGLDGLDCHNLWPHCAEMKHENGTVVHPPLLLGQHHVFLG